MLQLSKRRLMLLKDFGFNNSVQFRMCYNKYDYDSMYMVCTWGKEVIYGHVILVYCYILILLSLSIKSVCLDVFKIQDRISRSITGGTVSKHYLATALPIAFSTV